MSQYKILRIDQPDPLSVGKRRRRMGYFFVAISFLSAPLILVLHQQFTIEIGVSTLITLLLFGGLFLVLFLKLKSENKKYVTIGNIEFTRRSIIKRIGDSYTETSYDTIESIELQKHIPALTIFESKTGFYTYIISLIFKDSHKDNLIVSDRPLDKMQDLSITETLKTLKNITTTNIKII
jgi:hypothetical protein